MRSSGRRDSLADRRDSLGDRIEWSASPAPRLARAILLAVLVCYLGITALNLMSLKPSVPVLFMTIVALTSVFALQLVHSAQGADRASPLRKTLTLGAQAALTYLPLLSFGIMWGAMAGFLGGSLLLLLSPRLAWPLYGLTGLSLLVPGVILGMGVIDLAYMCQTTLLTGLVIFGVSRMSTLVDQVFAARAKIARMAVADERLRMARDLHDLLGYSLSAIVLKGELLQRLIAVRHDQAEREAEEVLAISRQALSDVRRVARGYRQMSLASEALSARSVLEAAELEVDLVLAPSIEDLSPQTSTVLATVLREGVTNLLRHSKASRCSITAEVDEGTARLTIVNNGLITGHHDSSPHSGNGLGNLRERLDRAGGRLVVEREPDGVSGSDRCFRLVAEAPDRVVGEERPQAWRDGDRSSLSPRDTSG
ncbi:sensor histidine kinase [Streptomyces sp. NPDC058092]|uniref:sensor histidine kinase n=1 Tax=Streptomyces sp. NPDC058092 TaxID=3346336 RepID=UPI0036F0650A